MGSLDRIAAKALALALLAALHGCAADCSSVNWRERGYADGFAGHPPQDLRLERECPKQGKPFSAAEYLDGWRDGHDEWDRLMGSIDYS